MEVLEGVNNIETYESFREVLINANFEQYDEIVQLTYEMKSNSEKFARANQYLSEYSSDDINTLIDEEINRQLTIESQSNLYRFGPCEDAWDEAAENCLEEFSCSNFHYSGFRFFFIWNWNRAWRNDSFFWFMLNVLLMPIKAIIIV